MKIAIISDTHDNLANAKKAMNLIKRNKINLLIHCGDIFEPETVKEILKRFSGKSHFILSDTDEPYFENLKSNSFKDFPGLKLWKEIGKVRINGKKIAFCHSHKTALGLAISQKYDIVFYGHLHKPWEVKIKKTKLVNPGNIAGLLFKATFAIYDTKTDKLELKIIP